MVGPGYARADGSALDNLSRSYGKVLHRYFQRRGFSAPDSEDAVQEVFARLAKREGLAEIERLEGYMFQTATHVAVDFHRTRATRQAVSRDLSLNALDSRADLSPEDIFLGREDMKLFFLALLELPERTRHAFTLSRLEQMKNAEFARHLGISVSAVEKHLVKALSHLGVRLGRPS